MDTTLRISALSTCEVGSDGTAIRLGMVDEGGTRVTIELPSGLAASLILTLPRLMQRSLQLLRGEASRLVFPLGNWSLEGAAQNDRFILTLQTPDGFGVAFALSQEDARGLGEALQLHCPAADVAIAARVLN